MISIIICSRRNQIDQKLEDNIKQSIGADFEFVIINNTDNKFSIFEAYNLGIQKSKGDVLCFLHDDILFHTQDWGRILELEFQKNPDFSLIGIAGAKVKTQFATGWWDCENKYKVKNILQHEKGNVRKEYLGFNDDNLNEVVAIDGVFMALKSSEPILFDTNLKGFHNYDLNLCCEILSKNKKIGVTKNILIEHFSLGTLDKNWFISTILFHKKYHKELKKNKFNFEAEIFAGKKYIDHYLNILGKKKGRRCFFYILKFSSSLKILFILQKYFLQKLLQKKSYSNNIKLIKNWL